MIVYGANDSSSREWLLRESELTLSKAISASHTVEETHKHAREILKSNEAIDLHKISKHSKFWGQITSQAKDTINPLMPGGNKKVTHT